MTPKIRILVIDDSAFVRQYLVDLFNNTRDMVVKATAGDPIRALELLKREDFEVITLDVQMPKMDGLTFLQYLMQIKPLPVVMISSWTKQNSDIAIKALSMGAVDCVAKPELGLKEGMRLLEEEILSKVRVAAQARINKKVVHSPVEMPLHEEHRAFATELSDKLIAIGASTGGTVALTRIFKDLRPDLPGIIVAQHMPGLFTPSFASSLNAVGPVRVVEASDGMEMRQGMAAIVPGGRSLTIRQSGTKYQVRVGPPLKDSIYNPCIDHTLGSVASESGANAMGVILTGMGADGAKGLKAMSDQGAYTVAQDEESSVVFGMPQKAVEFGGVRRVLPLDAIANEINKWGKK